MGYSTGSGGSSSGAGAVGVTKKTADETVNNSAALQNDDHLSFAVLANKVYTLRVRLIITNTSGTTGTIKFAFTVPAGAVVQFSEEGGGNPKLWTAVTTGAPFSQTALTPAGVYLNYVAHIIVAGTAGTAQFQWAQNAAAVYDLVMKQGTTIEYVEA